MDAAERQARDIAHDRWHRELADQMKVISDMKTFQDAHPGEHFAPAYEPATVERKETR